MILYLFYSFKTKKGCLKELIRQIGLNCKERASLLQKIWNAYLELFEKVILKNQHIQQKIEQLYISQTTRIHRIYQKEIDNFYLSQENLKKENFNLAKVALEMKETYKAGKKEKKSNEAALKLLKREHEKLKSEYNSVLKTNLELILYLEQEKKQVEENKIIIEEITVENEVLIEEKIKAIYIKIDREVDTQDLTQYYDDETMTEERFFNFKPPMLTKEVQTQEDKKAPIKKSVENYGIFEEFSKEKEKYSKQKRASISGGFIEEENYKLSGDMRRRGTNYLELMRFQEKENNTDDIKKASENDVLKINCNNNNDKADDMIKQEKKLPKYIRPEKKTLPIKNDGQGGNFRFFLKKKSYLNLYRR